MRQLSVQQAAERLGVEPAAVLLFVRLRMLRPVSEGPLTFRHADVERLHAILLRSGGPREAT